MMMDQINVASATVVDEREISTRIGIRHETRTFHLPGSIWAVPVVLALFVVSIVIIRPIVIPG